MSTSNELSDRRCVPCQGETPPLEESEWRLLHKQLGNDWNVIDGHHLDKTYRFKDFAGALEFVNRVGKLAEEQGHHPDIYLAWGKAQLKVWTHKIDGLTESDFILAAKADRLTA